MTKKVKLAFVLAGIGILAAAALRCVQMLCFFDYDTGFVTDSGLLTYIYCGTAIGVSLLCMLLCRVDKKLYARIETKRNAAAGASALLMCVFLFLCAAALLRDFYLYRNNQPTYFVQASHVTTHLPFAVLTLLFAIVSLVFAIIWLTGEGFPSGTGGLWAIGSVWGISYMIVTFMTYSAVATTEENIFTVGGGAMMLLFLLSEGKLLSGAGGKKALRSTYVFGLPAAVLWMTYVISNTVLIIAGRGYATEMPYVIQLAMLCLSVHSLCLLLTVSGQRASAKAENNLEENALKDTGNA